MRERVDKARGGDKKEKQSSLAESRKWVRVKRKAPAEASAKRPERRERSGVVGQVAATSSEPRFSSERPWDREREGPDRGRRRGEAPFISFGVTVSRAFRGGKIKYKGRTPVHREVYTIGTRRSENDAGGLLDVPISDGSNVRGAPKILLIEKRQR